MDADTWASLPCDLLVEILRRHDATAVIRCAGACRPWRRAIIGNASCLRPRPDRFNPNLLVGFFYKSFDYFRPPYSARLLYVLGGQGPLEKERAMAAATPWYMHDTTIGSFIPRAATHGVGVDQYDEPLSSRDGLLLLGGSGSKVSDLCLCNPMARSCRFLPAAAFGASEGCTYVLVTGDGDDDSAVWILAVRRENDVKRGVIYQIFSSASGEWGPVKRSAKFEKGLASANMYGVANDMVVCGGSVYWLLRLFRNEPQRAARRCVFAIDVRTERTWTTELPEKHVVLDLHNCFDTLILATSEDGRLSLILMLPDHQIEAWVLASDGEWTLRRGIDLRSLIPSYPKEGRIRLIMRGFCPRSGCLFGDFDHNKDLLIDVSKGSLRQDPEFCVVGCETKYPYEMDWPTYISKMKCF